MRTGDGARQGGPVHQSKVQKEPPTNGRTDKKGDERGKDLGGGNEINVEKHGRANAV